MSLTGVNRLGFKRGFTLIEVLIAVAILSIGMIGVARAYIVLMDGIEVSIFTTDASYLLKVKMADIEKEAIENFGVPSGANSGRFGEGYNNFGWQTEASEVKIGSEGSGEKTREWPEESLSKVRISIMSAAGHETGRRLNLYTYVENHPQ